jgi:scyllo-inositol 2-dehydrogenase (NADP+)
VRYVVVGYGNIGRRRAGLLGDRCVAVVDPLAAEAGYRSLDEVPAAWYDAAVVATPNGVKRDYVSRLLGLGKSVLVEKPLLFQSWAEAEALARRSGPGVTWYTSYNHRFEPLVARMREGLAGGVVGAIDRVRMVYGNGTVRNWRGTWRESGAGVIEDLGCHLIDLAGWLLARPLARWELLDLRSVESATSDYALFGTPDRRLLIEVGTVFWKNTFRIDVFGDAGSLHLDGLGKWGGATLVRRERRIPSGVPEETCEATGPGDPTWAADFAHFEREAAAGRNSLASDWAISAAVVSLVRQGRGRRATAPAVS